MIAQTSIEAYKELLPELSERQLRTLTALRRIGPANNTMIAKYTGLPINQVTGRVYELRFDKKLVGFSHSDKCPITGKRTNYWKVLDRRLK